MMDEDGLERLLSAKRVSWRSETVDADSFADGQGGGFRVMFEGHLCQLIEHESDETPGRFSLLVDGEPMGDLDEWPPGWVIGELA